MSQRNMRNITIQQLRALMVVAEERSFSRAADIMHLTQPSLTKHIQNLEEVVGISLLERKTRGITLTSGGRVLYESTRRIFRMIDDAGEKIKRLHEDGGGAIVVAASSIPATYILPHVIQGFAAHHPRIGFMVRTGDSDGTIDMILNDEAEIGFVGRPVTHRKLHAERLWKDRLSVAVPASHRWKGKPHVTLGELSEEPFVLRERGSATRATFESYLGRKKKNLAEFHIACELGSSEAVKEAVIAGLGVSVISHHAVAREVEDGVLAIVSLKEFTMERHIFLIYRTQFNLLPHHQLFLEWARKFTPGGRHG